MLLHVAGSGGPAKQMSKPFASSVSLLTLAAAVVGATALSLASPLPAAADDRGRWEQNDKKGKHDNHGRGQERKQNQWNGQRSGQNGWSGRGNGNHWQGGGRSNGGGNHWQGGGGHGGSHGDYHGGNDHRHGGGSNYYHYYKPHKVYRDHYYYYYSQPVYVPAPTYAYAPGFFCSPCQHWFASYDELYQHVAYAHYVPDYNVPNLVVQVGVNWVFGF